MLFRSAVRRSRYKQRRLFSLYYFQPTIHSADPQHNYNRCCSLSLSASAAAAEAKAANEAMCSMKITATGSPAELAAMDRMVAASNAWAKEVRALANAGGAEAAREVELVEAAAVDMAESWQRMKNLAGDV